MTFEKHNSQFQKQPNQMTILKYLLVTLLNHLIKYKTADTLKWIKNICSTISGKILRNLKRDENKELPHKSLQLPDKDNSKGKQSALSHDKSFSSPNRNIPDPDRNAPNPNPNAPDPNGNKSDLDQNISDPNRNTSNPD
jgi:hypothetical protein